MNQASYAEAYCRTNWANVVERAALSYHFTQNVHGGNCVPPDSNLVCPGIDETLKLNSKDLIYGFCIHACNLIQVVYSGGHSSSVDE